MTSPLFSQHWHRVAELRLRLRQHTTLHRHEYRGEPWYVLYDNITGQVHRFTPEAYQIIGRLDGQRTLHEIWEQVSHSLGDAMPTQHELVQLIGRLHSANVLAGDGEVDVDELARRQTRQRRSKWLQMLRSPLGIRIPLVDPERFVAASYPLVRPLISPIGGLLWLATVASALLLAAIHWSALTENLADRVLSVGNLLLLVLIYPLIKVIHELGHAWATKDAGGEVHEVGIMLLVFFPVPYVDASAAAACPDKSRRMLVGAAGILVEVFLASLAMFVWVMAEPGILRALTFNVMLIAGVSTLLFNGNPLLRFDAYYVMADYLEIPNLFNRANQQVSYLVKRYLLGRREVTSQAETRRESFWLVSYALASFAYRLVIMVFIAVFVATRYLFVGIILAIWSISMTLLLPLIKMLKTMIADDALEGSRGKAWSWLLITLAGLALFLFMVPAPYATNVHGVVDTAAPNQLRLGASGELRVRHADNGIEVRRGETLMELSAPELGTEVALLKAQRRETLERLTANVGDAGELAILRETLALVERQLEDAEQRVEATRVVSPRDGLLLMPEGEPPLGMYLERGAEVGAVVRPEDLRIRALLPTHRAETVRSDATSVALRLPGSDATLASHLQWVSPRSTFEIPSEILTRDGGGQVALNPQAEQPLTAFRRHYLADFSAEALVDNASMLQLGSRVHVRIEHPSEPLGYRLWRSLRRAFLRLFDV
ncbi:putative peptide zinc metalloprotease protein [Vreelandella subterranea]|uniref:Putative peptide zinc metalloprotease protein n=1 Tax=Vreelandella subterranea TaxID=416874 RepID=A0A1H9VQ82_9GAMM|nr:site-2 protease family protein [Halomonas subterranea]SES23708.1 putative peptide zinc metalloprotease protein [Halomonas subterranea]